MKYLKIEIEKMLQEAHPNVYLSDAEYDSDTPYLVYHLTSGTHREGQISYFLDVDVWDKAETTEKIDEITTALKRLHRRTHNDEHIQFTIYFDRVLIAPSKDREWKHALISFEVRAIEKGAI